MTASAASGAVGGGKPLFWPTGPRPYLPVTWPHCLLPHGTIRSERFRFGSMAHLLEHWAYLVFQAVETVTLCEAGPDHAAQAVQLARYRRRAAEHAELVRQIAASIGMSQSAADALVQRSTDAGRAIGAATLRREPADLAAFYPWYAMP